MFRAVGTLVAVLVLAACGSDGEPVAAADVSSESETVEDDDDDGGLAERMARERDRTADMSDDQLETRRDRMADALEDSAPGPWSDQRTESELIEALEATALVSQVDTVWLDRNNHMILIAGSASGERAVQDDGQLRDGAQRVMQALARELEPHNVTPSTFPGVGATVDLSDRRIECPSEVVHELFQAGTSWDFDAADDVMDGCEITS